MRRAILGLTAAAAIALALPALAQSTRAPAPRETTKVGVEVAVKGLAYPWAFQFLPDRSIIVTERGGTMRIADRAGRLSPPLAGVPAVAAGGQGGLLDIALAPDFAQTRLVYFSFSEPRGNGRNGTAVARARLALLEDGDRLDDVTVIFRQKPDVASAMHFGSRLAFAPDGKLFVTLGERAHLRDEAQNPSHHLGKVVRINPDGSVPADNPKLSGWAPEVWSIGHRNPQAAAINPASGKLWTIEHGARGGDEINRPEAGKNYGWPVITYGRDYSGAKIGIGTAKEGMEQPLYYWDPSIAPSGMAFYSATVIPAWKGSLFVGALAGEHVARLVLDGERVAAEEQLLKDLRERIRDVRQGPDGAIYVATDNANGRILRLVAQR